MGFQKTRDAKPEDPSIEDLEKRFAQLSIKAEEQGSFKVSGFTDRAQRDQ